MVSANVLNIRPIAEDFSLKSTIYAALKEAIVKVNIYDDNVDLRLDERSISEQFGISRTPLREALARLEQEGLVRVAPRRGIFIVRRSKAEILDMILAWAALESMAARLATAAATDAEIAGLRAIVDDASMANRPEQIGEYSETNIRFHQMILALSHSDQIRKLANDIFVHVRAIRNRSMWEEDRVTRSIADHNRIVETIEARDADQAERLVREHTLNLRDHVARHFDPAPVNERKSGSA